MYISMFAQLLFVFSILLPDSFESSLAIESINRIIDLSSSNVVINYDIVLINNGEVGAKNFLFPILTSKIDNIYHIKVTEDDKSEILMCKNNSEKRLEYSIFDLKFNSELLAGKSKKILIEFIMSGVFAPYPEAVEQTSRQTLKYNDSCHAISCYIVNSESTKIIVGKAIVSSFSSCPSSLTTNRQISIGPLTNVPAYTNEIFHLILENNMALPKLLSHTRVFHISQWGFLDVLESIVVKNDAAQIKGEYSRIVETRIPDNNGLNSFYVRIPASAYEIQYFDDLGNISTSSVTSTRAYKEIEIEPRFPIYGGWFTNFYIKYLLEPSKILYVHRHNPKSKIFKIPLNSVSTTKFVTDVSSTIVYLPEQATNAKAQITSARCIPSIEQVGEVHYLDLNGRIGFQVNQNNTCSETTGILEILYDYEELALLWKPLRVSFFFFMLFSFTHLCLIVRLPILDKHYSKSDTINRKLKAKAENFFALSRKYFLHAFNVCGVTDLIEHNKTTMSIESDLRISLKLFLDTLRDEFPKQTSIKLDISIVQRLTDNMLDLINEFANLTKKFISKEVTEEAYREKGLVITTKFQEPHGKLNRLFKQYSI